MKHFDIFYRRKNPKRLIGRKSRQITLKNHMQNHILKYFFQLKKKTNEKYVFFCSDFFFVFYFCQFCFFYIHKFDLFLPKNLFSFLNSIKHFFLFFWFLNWTNYKVWTKIKIKEFCKNKMQSNYYQLSHTSHEKKIIMLAISLSFYQNIRLSLV